MAEIKYPADHALQVAIEMERLGQAFYESLAAGCSHRAVAELAATLARSEASHVALFKHMRQRLPATHRGPALSEKDLYTACKELRDRIMPAPATAREASLDPRKGLNMAIAMEAHAVAYYSRLASSVEGLDATVLMQLVDEEKEHLRVLSEQRVRFFPMAGQHGGDAPAGASL